MTLKENGFHPERDWPMREHGVTYRVDLALPAGNKEWLPIAFSAAETSAPANSLCLQPDQDMSDCLKVIQQKLHQMKET